MVIHNVWVFTKKSGTSLCHKKYGSVEVDESIFSGFLSSINTLAEAEFDQKGIESIHMGNYKFMYESFADVVFTVAADPTDTDTQLKNCLKNMRKEFFNYFSPEAWAFFLKEKAMSGAVEEFNQFESLMDAAINKFDEEKLEELINKKTIIELYDNLLNIFFLKLMAFSDVLDEDFLSPLQKAIKDVAKTHESMTDLSITMGGIGLLALNLETIELKDLKFILNEMLEKIMEKGYELVGRKPINKIIAQLNPTLAMKLDEIKELGIC